MRQAHFRQRHSSDGKSPALGLVLIGSSWSSGALASEHYAEVGAESEPLGGSPVLASCEVDSVLEHDPMALQRLQEQLRLGGATTVQSQLGWPGAGVGFIAGFGFGGAGYLADHGPNGFQGNNSSGLMAAALGGAFIGAVSGGTATYTVTFWTGAMGDASVSAIGWFDSMVPTITEVSRQ